MEKKQPEYINPTIVVFNDKLKKFIKKIEDEIDISVLSFDYNNAFMCDCIFECQKEIRNYIIQNQECFDTVDGKKLRPLFNYQEIYSIMVLLLIDDLNDPKYDCFESIVKELKRLENYNLSNRKKENEYYKNNFELLPYDQDEPKKCFCGHHCLVRHIYVMTNKNNDKILLTGCDCITKNKIKTKDEMKKNNYKRRVEYFKNKNDISKIEYAGGTKLMDFKYYTENYDDDKTTILDDICCDVCKICKRKAGKKPKEEIEDNSEEKTEKKINYYFFYNNIDSEIFIF